MKSVVASVIILVFIFGLMFFSSSYVNSTANDMASSMETILTSAEEENWETVNGINNENIEKWHKISKVYNCIFHHDEVDKISIYMEEIDKYIKTQEKTDTMAAAASLRFLFEHLSKKDQASWENII